MSELIPKFKDGQVVRAEWEGKSVNARITEVKEYNNELTYLIGNCWCCANDIKKWIPKVNDKVITTKILHKYNIYNENYIKNEYNIIGTVIEVREKENSVILDDYSSVLIKDLKPYIEGTK